MLPFECHITLRFPGAIKYARLRPLQTTETLSAAHVGGNISRDLRPRQQPIFSAT